MFLFMEKLLQKGFTLHSLYCTYIKKEFNVTPISNYRLSREIKRQLQRAGKKNESEGIRFLVALYKKLGDKRCRELLEGKNECK